jgi:hypothetical protein
MQHEQAVRRQSRGGEEAASEQSKGSEEAVEAAQRPRQDHGEAVRDREEAVKRPCRGRKAVQMPWRGSAVKSP